MVFQEKHGLVCFFLFRDCNSTGCPGGVVAYIESSTAVGPWFELRFIYFLGARRASSLAVAHVEKILRGKRF